MEMGQGLQLNQSQKLVMTTKLMQSLRILTMNSMELESEIDREVNENPILEVDDKLKEREIDWEKYIKDIQKTTYFDSSEYGYNPDNEVDFENIVKSTQSLSDYLKDQIAYYNMSPKEMKVCKYIIDSLDDNGYLNLEDSKYVLERFKIDLETYNRCKSYVQSLEPNGVGGMDLRECLLIQIRNLDIRDDLLERIINEDLEYVANKKIKQICKKYSIDKELCLEYINIIKKLDPKPGRLYANNCVDYITPDVIIRKIGEEFVVISNDRYNNSICINKFYENMLTSKKCDEDARKYIKGKLNDAINLIKNIENRKNTTEKIANSILKRQTEFFEKGEQYIKPMRMQDIAEELDVHQSTISRGVNGKYMLTPLGIYEFKYFFSNGLETDGKEDTSIISIKKIIKDKIKTEDKKKPLSDEKLKKILNEEGINVARRTVAKYREDMGIASSSKRKIID